MSVRDVQENTNSEWQKDRSELGRAFKRLALCGVFWFCVAAMIHGFTTKGFPQSMFWFYLLMFIAAVATLGITASKFVADIAVPSRTWRGALIAWACWGAGVAGIPMVLGPLFFARELEGVTAAIDWLILLL